MNQVMLVGKVDYFGEEFIDVKPAGSNDAIRVQTTPQFTQYIHRGNVVGVKGKLVNKEYGLEVVCERLTLLSEKQTDNE